MCTKILLCSCTAVASIYNVGTGDSSDPEIYFDAEDAYGTTGVLSLQLDVLHEGFVNYTASIHNRYYNSLAWTTTFGATVIVSGCLHASCSRS